MRRALAGIVPDEILNRKTKAFVARAPLIGISKDWTNLIAMTQEMVSSSLGIVDSERLLAAMQEARRGEHLSPLLLTRAIYIERWLRSLLLSGIVNLDPGPKLELALHASA